MLFVYDTKSFYYVGLPDQKYGTLTADLINHTSDDAHHSGVSFETVLLMDLKRVDLKRFHVVVFVNTFLMDAAQRKFIKEKVAKNGRTIVWLYAPGYTDGKTLDIKRMSDLIGMNLKKVEFSDAPQIVVDVKSTPFRIALTKFGLSDPAKPLFAVEDKDAKVLGRYYGTKHAALACKKLADSVSWYCALPLRDPNLMREIFRIGGANIYDEENDVIFAGGDLLVVHTQTGGLRKLSLPDKRVLEVDLKPRSTTVFDWKTGKQLLE